MKKHAKEVVFLLIGLFLISSCNQTNNQGGISNKDPKLILKYLRIGKTEVDVNDSPMTCGVRKEEIEAREITARFDYGDEEEEAIGVELEGGTFVVDKTQPKAMKMRVPASKGLYQEWTGVVMINVEAQDMEVAIGFDGKAKPDGAVEELKTEVVEFIVQCREDHVDKAIINDGTTDHELKLKEFEGPQDSKFYANRISFLLDTEAYTTYKITVKPKDSALYSETVVSYKVKGTKIPDNNAEFIYIAESNNQASPDVNCDITWVSGCESTFYEDYGAKSLKMTAYTVSPRASVFVKTVNPTDDSLIGTEVMLTGDGKGMHEGVVTLFPDKPTKLIAYVKSKNNTTDDEKGKWQMKFNSVDLFWGYDDTKLFSEALRKDANKGYSEIIIEKSKATTNKVYIAFSIWGEKHGFIPSDTVKGMSDFAELDTVGDDDNGYITTYKFSVDVQSLNVGDAKNIEIPILRFLDANGTNLTSPIEAFKYALKLKIS